MRRLLTAVRLLAVTLVISCALAGPAAAQDDSAQALPDPGDPVAASSAQGGGDLPSTGIEAFVLIGAGASLLAGGLAVLPVARRRRTYDSFEWRHSVALRSLKD